MEQLIPNKIEESSLNINIKYLNYYLEKIESLFKDDKFLKSFELVKLINKKITEEEIKHITQQDVEDNIICCQQELNKTFNSNRVISVINDDMELTMRCSDLLNMMNTTKAERESKGIQTWFKYEETIKSITICGRTHVKGDILHILAVLAEVDLMKNFIDRFEDLILFGSVSPFRMLVHSKINMPIMIDNRDLVLCGFGMVNNEDKSILIPFKSIEDKKYIDIPVPEETNKYKRVILNHGFFHLKHIDENTYLLSNSYNVDPKVPVVPWFVLNSIIKEISFFILDGIRSQIENTKNREIYKKRVEEKKDFYDKIKKEMCVFEK